jgi:hypothetical protein
MPSSNIEIIEQEKSVGVSLGESSSQRNAAANLMRYNELNRTLTLLERNAAKKDTYNLGEASLIVSKVSNLCDDLVEEEVARLDDLDDN